MDVPVTENHKVSGASEHVSLKETVTNEVDALPAVTSLEVGQGDNASINPPSESSVQMEINKELAPSETVQVLEDLKEHVNNEPSEFVPNMKTVSTDNTGKPAGSTNDVGVPPASELSTSIIEPEAVAPAETPSNTGTIAPLEVAAEKSSENNQPSAPSPLSDVSSGDMEDDFEDSVVSDKCNRDVTIGPKETNKLEILSVTGSLTTTVKEKSCDKEIPSPKSPIPSERENLDVVNNPADNDKVKSGNGMTVEVVGEDAGDHSKVTNEIPCEDVSKVATDQMEEDVVESVAETTKNKSSLSNEVEKEAVKSPMASSTEVDESVPSPCVLPTNAAEEASVSTPSTEAAHEIAPSLITPSSKSAKEMEANESTISSAVEEGGLLNESTLSSEAAVKTTHENSTPLIELVEAEKSMDATEVEAEKSINATELPTDTTKEVGNDLPISQNVPLEDDTSTKGEDTSDSRGEPLTISPPEVPRGDTAPDDESKSNVSEEKDLKSQDERPKSTPPEEETSVNLSEVADEDQEMQEFEHVSSKDAEGDKDLGEPMSVEVVDESAVEESMEVNPIDEDPIGLANEPETKLDEGEEPMDVDDTSDKEKSQDVSESNEKSLTVTTEQKEGDSAEKDSSAETVANASADKADDSLEIITGDKSGTDRVDATSATTSGDQPQDEAKEADEEICIIPDTIRVIGNQDLVDKSQSTSSKDKPGNDDDDDAEESGKKDGKNKNDKGKEDKTKAGAVRSPGRRGDKSPAVIEVEAKKKEYSGRPQRQAALKAVSQIKELAKEDSNSGDGLGKFQADDIKEVEPSAQMCYQCCRVTECKYQVYIAGQQRYLCQEPCHDLFRSERDKGSEAVESATTQIANTARDFVRKCGQCEATITGEEKNLSWETMDFCNEECLGKYQTQLGSFCANCKGPTAPASLGKYCVRFGYDIKQFCCSSCLEEFKKGLKVCSYCQKDISSGAEGFLAPVGDKGQFKDFCTQKCMEKYDNMSNNVTPPVMTCECAVCNNEKVVKFQFILNSKLHKLCSEPCFAAFKFVNSVKDDQCDMCKKFFDKVHTEVFTVYYDETPHSFCCKTCMNVYILANRKIVPCSWCKVKKYNFDMIKRVIGSGQVIMMCSLNCLTLYQVSVSAVSSKRITCDMCSGVAQAQYHLTMSDATIRNFCSYQCVMSFQGQFGKAPPLSLTGSGDKAPAPAAATPAIPATPPIPTGGPKRVYPTRRSINQSSQNDSLSSNNNSLGPVISSVTSLAPTGQASSPTTRSQALKIPAQANNVSPPVKQQVLYKQQLLVKPPAPKVMRNKFVSCKPLTVNKGVSCRPHACNKETQTDDSMGKPVLIPIPVPIYVPAPMHMYCSPFPVPVPFPLPIPVPMFIPTTRRSAQGILREIKRIQEKIPTDPFEAELLMMAEMVADDKKPATADDSDSESDAADNEPGDAGETQGASSAAEGGFSPEAVDTSNFGEDMLQMALKMASELEEPAVDLEAALTPSTITAQSNTSIEHNDTTESEVDDPEPAATLGERATSRGRKRSLPTPRRATPSKRGRRISSSGGGDLPLLPPPEPAGAVRVEQEKPDANMCLKYTFGVNAWRQWVSVKNNELEKAASNNRKLKLFKPEILQLTSDELNYSLCLFVKEVRKPNGTEYAPDTIYYLVLGIQQYLFENGRIDNIFTDPYYEKFTECLDEVAKKFAVLYNDQQYIVTRVEEEHLWESKQLGAHSPHVLLSTLMFFNTKHFNLTTVEEHMQLSFSHIMKHWKRNPNQPGGVTKVPGSRNVLLRFYPPQSSLEANSKKKKVYEQQENEDNPLRCPVKLYEFYLSKCPESVKTRNDVFYLLPERSCVPDSPVWYSTMALGKDPLMKMLHRVKMVKEINIALLQP